MSEYETRDPFDHHTTFTTAQGNPVVQLRDTVGAAFLGVLSLILLVTVILTNERNRRLTRRIAELEAER